MGYDGFISYSHAADGKFAPALQDGLQKMAKPWYRRRALDVFRDNTGLSANPGLWSSITAAMDESEYFILLASPDAAESPWVNREIEAWRDSKDVARLLPVLTEGEWVWDESANDFDWAASTAIPAALAGVFTEEPRHLDMRWVRSETDLDLRNSRFRDQIAELAAPMHGMAKDELEGADIRAHRRARRLAAAAIVLLFLLTLSAGAGALIAKRNADEASRNEMRALAAQTEADDNAREAEANAEVAEANADEADRQRSEAQANAEEARENADEADRNADEADANAAEADSQRGQAEANAAEAEANAAEAEANAAEADSQRGQAETNAAEAEANAAEAQAQREQAEANAQEAANNAREADTQRAQALAFAEDADRERAEAEAQRALAEQNADEAQRQQAIAEQNADEAQRQTDLAEDRADALNAEQLAAQALLEKDSHLDRALLLAVEAVGIGGPDHLGANNALLDVIQEANGVEQFLPIPAGIDGSRDFLTVAVSPDGSALAASDGHDVVIWTFAGTEVTGTLLIDPGEELVTDLEFPRPDRLVGVTSTNLILPGVKLWDATTGSELASWGNQDGDGLEEAGQTSHFVTPGAEHMVIQEFQQIYLYGTNLAWAQVVDLDTGDVGSWWYGVAKNTEFSADGNFAIFTDWFNGRHTVWDLENDQLTTLYSWSSPSPDWDSAGQVIWGVASGYFASFDPATADVIDFFPVGFFNLADADYNSTTQTVALLDVTDDAATSPPSASLWIFDVTTGSYLNSYATDPCSKYVRTSPTGLWFYTLAQTTEIDNPSYFDPYCYQSNGARDATEVFYAPAGQYWTRIDGLNQSNCRNSGFAPQCYGAGAFFENDRFAFQTLTAQEGSRTVRRLAVYDLFAGQAGALVWADESTDVSVAWSSDRTFVATSSDGTRPARLWTFDGTSDGLPVDLEGSLSVRQVAVAGSRVMGAGTDNAALVWDASANRSTTSIDTLPGIGAGGSAALSGDGNRVAYSTGDGVVRMRDVVGGGEQVLTTLGPGEALYLERPFDLFGTDQTTPFVFDPAGSRVVVNVVNSLGERVGRIYDTATGQLQGSVPYPVVDFSGDGEVLLGWDLYAPLPCIGCPVDADLHLFRTADQTLVGSIPIITDYPVEVFASAALDSNGGRIAASTRKGKVVVWDVATGTVITELNTFGAPDAPLGEQQLAWSPTDDRLVYAAGNSLNDDIENWHLWDTATWELKARVDLDRSDFDSIADALRFSPDGARIVTPQGYVLDGYAFYPLGGRLRPSPDLPGFQQEPTNADVAFRSNSELVMLSQHPGATDDLYQITTFGIVADPVLGCELAGRNLSQLEWSRFFGDAPYRSTCTQHPPGT